MARINVAADTARLATLPGSPERERVEGLIASNSRIKDLIADAKDGPKRRARVQPAGRIPDARRAIRENTNVAVRTASPREQFTEWHGIERR